jgi:hypothetical protein
LLAVNRTCACRAAIHAPVHVVGRFGSTLAADLSRPGWWQDSSGSLGVVRYHYDADTDAAWPGAGERCRVPEKPSLIQGNTLKRCPHRSRASIGFAYDR